MPDRYFPAAICRRGHVESSVLTDPSVILPRCSECGAKVLMACESCGGRIRGSYHPTGRVFISDPYDPPNFCDVCGTPHPWASREVRFFELENLLEEEDLDPATQLKVRDELEQLRVDPLEEEATELERWVRVKKLAPGFYAAGERIIESVVTAAVKAQLGL
jgi:hypothetical protein